MSETRILEEDGSSCSCAVRLFGLHVFLLGLAIAFSDWSAGRLDARLADLVIMAA